MGTLYFTRRIILICVCLLAACDALDPTPELIAVSTPTPRPTIPTATPTITPSATATVTATPTTTSQPTATSTPIAMSEIVIVVKPLPVGYPIPPEALMLYPWPAEDLPEGAFSSIDEVVNMVTLTDLVCYQPVVSNLIARRTAGTEFFDLEDTCNPIEPVPDFAPAHVVVAVGFIRAGERIEPHMVTMQVWPQALAPAHGFNGYASVLGKRTLTDLLSNQPILSPHITP